VADEYGYIDSDCRPDQEYILTSYPTVETSRIGSLPYERSFIGQCNGIQTLARQS